MAEMRYLRDLMPVALLGLTSVLSSCGDDTSVPPPPTYAMGERVSLGRLVYVVYETQWLTQLGDGADAHVPQHRFFLVRLSAVNGSGKEVIVPNFTIEDDSGNSYPEIGGDRAQGVPQYIGYLRRVKPAESAQGNAVFDAPPRHYKIRLLDEESDKSAYVDIPLSFTSESPEVPQVGNPKDDQPRVIPPKKK
jgi:Domain of unknown function (DUF4352)